MQEDDFLEFSYKKPLRDETIFPQWYENTYKKTPIRRMVNDVIAPRLESLSDLDLSIRTTNILENDGIKTVKQLIGYTIDELFEIRNFGETSLREIRKKLADNGLLLVGDSVPDDRFRFEDERFLSAERFGLD
jgi:DNA-directed RNA polymerase alpha subunit